MLILISVYNLLANDSNSTYICIYQKKSSLNLDFKNLKQNCSKFFTTHPQTSEYFSNFQQQKK